MLIFPGTQLLAAAATSVSRRDAIVAAGAAAASPALGGTVVPPSRAAGFIHEYANEEFLSSVAAASYRFLYRGLPDARTPSGDGAAVVDDDPYDLLDPETYRSDEAAAYFADLDGEMEARGLGLRPGNSHLATSSPADASSWGTAASVWPLGPDASFAWFDDRRLFWPVEKRGRTLLTDASSDLSAALCVDGCEVMFRSDGGYLAVPSHLDRQLRQQLISMTR